MGRPDRQIFLLALAIVWLPAISAPRGVVAGGVWIEYGGVAICLVAWWCQTLRSRMSGQGIEKNGRCVR